MRADSMPPRLPADHMEGVEVITFGCRLNAFESDVIRRAAGEHPDARIIVTGCAATLSPARYALLDEVDLVLDNDAKLKADSYVSAPHPNPLPASGERERAVALQPLAPF